MSRTVELSDEEYGILEAAAREANTTPEEVLHRLVRTLLNEKGIVYDTVDEMFNVLDAFAASNAERAKWAIGVTPCHPRALHVRAVST